MEQFTHYFLYLNSVNLFLFFNPDFYSQISELKTSVPFLGDKNVLNNTKKLLDLMSILIIKIITRLNVHLNYQNNKYIYSINLRKSCLIILFVVNSSLSLCNIPSDIITETL